MVSLASLLNLLLVFFFATLTEELAEFNEAPLNNTAHLQLLLILSNHRW